MFREEKLAAYTALQEQLEGLLQVGLLGGVVHRGCGWQREGCRRQRCPAGWMQRKMLVAAGRHETCKSIEQLLLGSNGG